MEIKSLVRDKVLSPIGIRRIIAGLILLVFVLPNVFTLDAEFLKARLAVLSNPRSPQTHLRLAEIAANKYDWEIARKEFRLATKLYEQGQISDVSDLSFRIKEVESTVFAERYIREEIKQWEEVLARQPGYRDGYLELAILHQKLSENSEALENWQKAWELDPNDEQVVRVGRLLGAD
jgi:tetratricopeptide (TPR) repeat protein